MQLGIFARTFKRTSLAETLDAVVAHGFSLVHLGMLSAGLDAMPADITQAKIDEVRRAIGNRGLEIASLSGTFNMIHPDPAVVGDGLARLEVLAAAARRLGTGLITLCTGSRDPDDMWSRHADNDTAQAWDSLIASMSSAIEIAERHDVILGIETEPGNVVNSPVKCRRLIDHFGSRRLKVVFDPANLVSTDLARDPSELLNDAFEMLGGDVIIGHAKDCGPSGAVVPAGRGIVPWKFVFDRLEELSTGFGIPMIIHGVEESDVAAVSTYLRSQSGASS